MPDAFAQLLDDHWEFTMRMDPVWATMTGDHRFDDRLPEARASMAERLTACRSSSVAWGH
jgi:hypothetical protein